MSILMKRIDHQQGDVDEAVDVHGSCRIVLGRVTPNVEASMLPFHTGDLSTEVKDVNLDVLSA